MIRPACMSDDEMAGWLWANENVRQLRNRASTPCVDCTLAFATEMRALGMCDGIPHRQAPPRPGAGAFHVELSRKRRANVEAALVLFRTGISRAEVGRRMGVHPATAARYVRDGL